MMERLRKITGKVLMILGGFICGLSVMCLVFTLLGLMETNSFGEVLELSFGFLLFIVVFGGMFLLGRKLNGSAGKEQPMPRKEVPTPLTPIAQTAPSYEVIEPETTPPMSVSFGYNLSEALESGDVGCGTTHRGGGAHEVVITTTATAAVRYYYFADGTLLFVGKGATKPVDMGGHDGRYSYTPEEAPWSELVKNGTRRAVFTEGITSVGSGLLMSLTNLRELELADSVESVHYNQIKSVEVLRCGSGFHSFNGFTGNLKELRLPDGPVHFQYHNGGSLPGATSDDPAVRTLLLKKLQMEYAQEMTALFRNYPGVAEKLSTLPWYDREAATSAIGSLDWNSSYKNSRLVPKEDLWELHGLPKKAKNRNIVTIALNWQYGHHDFMKHAAMVHAVLVTNCKELHCNVDWLRVSEGFLDWWKAEFPGIKLVITDKAGYRSATDTPPMPKRMAVNQSGAWKKFDYRCPRGYGYEEMLQRTQWIADHLLVPMTLVTADIAGAPETEHIDAFKACGSMNECIGAETGVLGLGGACESVGTMVKIYWYNQTNVLRIFTAGDVSEEKADALVRCIYEQKMP